MVRFGSAVPLLAAAFSAVVAAHVVPGAFIFEFEDNQVRLMTICTMRVIMTGHHDGKLQCLLCIRADIQITLPRTKLPPWTLSRRMETSE